MAALVWLSVVACGGQQPPPIAIEHEVEVRLVGSGEGAVVSRPTGIETSEGSFAASYVEGTRVTLRAIEGDASRFDGFSLNGGDTLTCESGSGPTSCVVTVDRALAIDVAFTAVIDEGPPEVLTVTVSGEGSGAVTSFPAGVDTAGDAFTAEFERDTVISLTASADPDSTFAGFSFPDQPGRTCDAGSTSTSCVLTLDETLVVDARFDELPIASPQRYDLLADAPIAAGELALDVPSGVVVLGVEPLRDVVVRHAVVDDWLHLAWLGDDAAPGGQVQVRLSHEIDPASITFTAVAYASLGGAPLDTNAFAWSGPSENAPTAGFDLEALPTHDASTVTLQASFAESPLADLDGNGALDVRDAMLLLQRLTSGGWSDFQRYHGDVDGDDVIDGADLSLLLERLVDTRLPARPQVKPSSLAFRDLDTAALGPGLVLVANAGREPFTALSWSAPSGTVVSQRTGGLTGHASVFDVSVPAANRIGWGPGQLRFEDGPGQAAAVRLGHVVVLIGGQSNAVGLGDPVTGWGHVSNPAIRVLGSDDVWRNALEPLAPSGKYSFGTRLGELVLESTGYETYLIPSAVSGSGVEKWLPASDDLFPPAIRRARVSAGLQASNAPAQPFPAEGGPVSAIVWYQGEFDAESAGRREAFTSRTNEVMDGFVTELDVPVFFVQLASHFEEGKHVDLHRIAELQRRMETGAGPSARQRYHMVVAFDLPRSDHIHISAYGQRVLAERIELAIRQHVLGEDVDGTGPRLTSIQWSGQLIALLTTHTLAADDFDRDLFTVFEGSASGTEIAVIDAVRHPTNPTGVLLTLERTPGSLPFVRYMGRPNLPPATAGSDQDAWDRIATGTIRASDGGLPLPAFGPLAPF